MALGTDANVVEAAVKVGGVAVDLDAPAFLLKGDDEVLLEQAVVHLTDALIGEADRSLVLEELDSAAYETGHDDPPFDLARLVDAAQTPPFLTDMRVVVGHHLAMFGAGRGSVTSAEPASDESDEAIERGDGEVDEPATKAKASAASGKGARAASTERVAALLAYLADPLPSTKLVLVWSKPSRAGIAVGGVPPTLGKALKAAGGVSIDTSAPAKDRDRRDFLTGRLHDAHVRLDERAKQLVAEQLGEDLGRLEGLLDLLHSTYGEGAALGVAEIEPFLGEAGGVPPWDLTDALAAGDIPKAITVLHRMLGGGERHPFVVMATLVRYYEQLLTLDGSGARNEADAAATLGIHPFTAKKALAHGRKLGGDGLQEAFRLLADADVDLRGTKDWPSELVLEVLVARLARQSRR